MGVDAVLFIAGGLILVFWAFPRAYAWIHVLGLRFRRPRVELTDPTTLPAPLRPVFEEIVQTLRELGFQYSHAQWTDGLVTHEGRRPYLVFVHPETNSYAAANPSALENGPRVFDVVFTTAYESGSVVATFDGVEHLALALPPTWECYDHFLNDPTEQWEAHRRAIARVQAGHGSDCALHARRVRCPGRGNAGGDPGAPGADRHAASRPGSRGVAAAVAGGLALRAEDARWGSSHRRRQGRPRDAAARERAER
jgi:hypothetical protein